MSMETRSSRQNSQKKNRRFIFGLIIAVTLTILYILFGPLIPYGNTLLTIKEYKGIKQEEKLVNEIVYGYKYTLTDKYYSDEDVEENSEGIPRKTISATKLLTKRIIDKNGLEIGDLMMGQIYRDFLGKDEIETKGHSNDIKKDVPEQLSSLNSSAMIDLSNRKIIKKNNTNKTDKIAKQFAKNTDTIRY